MYITNLLSVRLYEQKTNVLGLQSGVRYAPYTHIAYAVVYEYRAHLADV